ncbi:methionyl-tRNA formyltransferase [Candidatus Laterigemmans baculatus]|uniref:methionyl-tRNA formyltransferase n=1 Tax=Candidatus Laterigemmans baculatus TaxID=2770505 RepID=UPI0013DC17AC|nr:methionyl-tRNA formyltransferase [Candidatus Laterigemmans baculatus]
MPELRLVLMGTGPFAVPSFEALAAAGYAIATVVTRPERPGPGNRPPEKSPVRQWAEARQLPVIAPDSINTTEAIETVRGVQPDLLVVCDYGQILKPAALAAARLGGINLHGSLLPAYRGAAPVQWAVLCGDQETGVSVIHMTPQLDAGPVITSRRTPIAAKETAGELEARLAELGVEATLEAVAALANLAQAVPTQAAPGEAAPGEAAPAQAALGEGLRGQPQDAQAASRAPRLSKADGRIVWTRPAAELEWHVRGMQPWPGAFTEVPAGEGRRAQSTRLMITEVEATDRAVPEQVAAGTVEIEGDVLLVAAGDFYLRLERLKPAGKREMASEEWLRGRPLRAGTVLH